jgi:hypothetical protein
MRLIQTIKKTPHLNDEKKRLFFLSQMRRPQQQQRTQTLDSVSAIGGSGVAVWILFCVVMLMLVSLCVTVLTQSPAVRNELLTPASNPTYTYITDPPTEPDTTTPLETTAATSAPATTTAASLVPDITIVCPDDVTVVLGYSLSPTYTGGSPVAAGGCTQPSPVLQYVDTVEGKRKRKREIVSDASLRASIGRAIDSSGLERGVAAWGSCTSLDASSLYPGRRSPTFNASNLALQALYQASGPTGTPRSDVNVAIGLQHIMMAYNGDGNATLISVLDKVTMAPASGSFSLGLLGQGNCTGTTTRGQAQVLWDYEAQLWVALELGAAGSFQVCLYISTEASLSTTTWRAFVYTMPYTSAAFDSPQLSVWGSNVYTLSMNGAPESLCVLDRAALLAYTAFTTSIEVTNSTDNTTTTVVTDVPIPSFFCAAPFNGALAGLTQQAWMTVHVESSTLPLATESMATDTVGALFMRAVDDELHYGASTPTTDQIEIEHWYNVNFTTTSYNALRYKVAVQDFDHAPSYGPVPTPTAQSIAVDPMLTARAQYRRIEASDEQESVVLAVSTTGGLQTCWFELRWLKSALNTAPIWRLYQQSVTSASDGLYRFLPAANMDGNGTIAITYTTCSAISYPSIVVSTRLANDPDNEMREEFVVVAGALASTLDSSEWGRAHSIATDPVAQRRDFYVAGDVSDISVPWVAVAARVRIAAEVVTRTWTAFDYCDHSATCVQTIVCE